MKLKLFRINEGGLYSGENPLEVDFTKSKKVGLTGDSEVGKTTGLVCFKLILAALVADQEMIDDLINKISGKLDIEHLFRADNGIDYVARMTKSQYYLREEGSTKDIPEPKKRMLELVGRVVCNPIEWKDLEVDELLKRLAVFSKQGADAYAKKMAANKEGRKLATDGRAAANKAGKARREMLIEAGYMGISGDILEKPWVEAEKRYASKLDVKALSEKLTRAGNKSDKFIENEIKVQGQRERKKQIDAQIAALQKELTQVDENIQVGEKWLKENENVKKDYDAVKKEYDNAARFAADYEAWQTVLRHKAELDEYETIAQKADAKEKELLKEKKELEWEVIPDCRSISIVLEDEYEDGKLIRKAGYYEGEFNSRQMSATQFLTSVLKPLRKLGVKILVLDDVSTYGSPLMAEFEKLSREGWYILYAEQKRGQELTIEY